MHACVCAYACKIDSKASSFLRTTGNDSGQGINAPCIRMMCIINQPALWLALVQARYLMLNAQSTVEVVAGRNKIDQILETKELCESRGGRPGLQVPSAYQPKARS